ncbi:MAG: amino acid-binding protein [Hyphomicrobiales bacterium]|nr:amino acid-binding protein [Hyphomicrobiales bacterium]
MAVELVLTVIARDRPGLVETVADVVAVHGGNWIDSAMARLGGEFAGILRITVPDGAVAGLEEALGRLKEKDISVIWRSSGGEADAAGAKRARLSVIGQDHTGIVRDVTAALARVSVSVDRLNTTVFPGAMSGAPMFVAEAEIVVPDDVDLDDLRDALERIANDIMVEVELNELELEE